MGCAELFCVLLQAHRAGFYISNNISIGYKSFTQAGGKKRNSIIVYIDKEFPFVKIEQ